MTDIIFKKTITQPASNVVDLNFIDGVVALGFAPVSSILFQAQFSFEIKSQPVIPTKQPINVSVESVIGIEVATGFKVVHQGNGDPYFDKVKLLCHFDRSTGNGAAYNVANRMRGLISGGIKDADTVVDYIADADAFEGDMVSCSVIVNSFLKANNAFIGTAIPASQYQGDYGKNLSVRGKDWCFDARLKIDDQYSYNGLDIFKSKEIRVNVFLYHIYNSQNVSVPVIRVNLSLDNAGYSFISWDKIQIVDGDFSTIKLLCVNGKYELWVDGELFYGSARYASTIYKPAVKSYIKTSLSHAIAPFNAFHVGIDIYPDCSLPTYQLFGEYVALDTFVKSSIEYTPENLAMIQALPNFQSITTTQKSRVYLSARDKLDSRFVGSQDANNLTKFGIDHIVVASNYIEVFFDQTIIVQQSIRFDFPNPITVHFECDLLKVATGAISGYQGGSALLYCGNFVLSNQFFVSNSLTFQVSNGVCNISYSTLANTSATLNAKNITYVDGISRNFTFNFPELGEINDTTSCVIYPNDLYGSYWRNLYRVIIATQKSDRISNGKQITDVTEIYSSGVSHPDTGSYTTDFDAAVAATQDITKLKTLGDTGIINYSIRQDPVISNDWYKFGIERFVVDKNYIEIIFDGITFVESSCRFNTPFELKAISTPQGNVNNYDAIFVIANNEFSLLITKMISDTGEAISISYAPQVFVATVKDYDSKVYDASNANYLTVNGDNLDEMRFTIGASRIDERGIVPTEPFPDFIENRISFKPNFEMGAVYDFGKNNLISIAPNFKFKDFTKKPKITTPTTKVITLGRVSLIEVLPSFNFTQEHFFNFDAQISVVSNATFGNSSQPVQQGKCDLLFSDVVALLPFDSSPIIDVMNHAVTSGINAQITNGSVKFLPDSVYFPAVAGQEVKVAHDDRMGVRKGDIFCIEFWFYAMPQASTISPVIIAQFGAAIPSTVNTNYYTFNWRIVRTYDNRIYVDYGSPTGGYSNIGQTSVFTVKEWHHLRITNEGYYLDGVKITTLKTFDVFTQGSFKPDFNPDWIIQFGITNAQGQLFKGYVSDFRMTKGDNRLTDILPPTDSYPTVACGSGVTPTPTPAPVITPILFKPLSTISFVALANMQAFYPIKFNPKSVIEINIDSDFEVFYPIQFFSQNIIGFLPEFDLQKTKVELIYLAAENRSKASTGFVDKLLSGFGVSEIFSDGIIEFYTGSRPYSANHAATGILLGSIKGIQFGVPQNRIIKKDDSQMWLLNAIASGKIGWFRIKTHSLTDYGQDSLVEARIDGEAGIDSISSNFYVASGDIYHIQDFAVMWGNG